MGGYKRSPTAALEREADVAPIELYMEEAILHRTRSIQQHQVEKEMTRALEAIWERMEKPLGDRRRTRGQRQTGPMKPRPLTILEGNRTKLNRREHEGHLLRAAAATARTERRQHRWKTATAVSKALEEEWRKDWRKHAEEKQAPTWTTDWKTKTIELYEGLTKVEATVAFLLRTEVLGLRAWLAQIRVPRVSPECECG
jgi:hypothetical protein